MQTSGNTILITGGATGIGLSIAEIFLKENNQILVCGRREEKLREAKQKFPELQTRVCDIANAKERQGLYHWATSEFPEINFLINNAGIQREIDLTEGTKDLLNGDDEIEINFQAHVQLTALFIPHLMKLPKAAIMNVTSGLGFVPLAFMPIYCATKAAMHSFTWSLRYQLRKTSIQVIELIPPTVDTELDRGARQSRNQVYRGIPPRPVAEAMLAGLKKDETEITVGQSEGLRNLNRQEAEKMFLRMNGGD
jgi:uncharacterized oxidoreductase